MKIEDWLHIQTRTGIDWHRYRIINGDGHVYEVTLEPRPVYCDRGHWIGKCHGVTDLDGADAFPRYYMDCDRAKAELADWLKWRVGSRHEPATIHTVKGDTQ